MTESRNHAQEFERVYREYYSRLYYFAYDFVEDTEQSKDIVSEVFETIWNNWEQMDMQRIGSYLFVSVKNKCINHLRRNRHTDSYEDFLNTIADEDPQYWTEMDEMLREVMRVIDTLPPKTRRVFEECYFNNHTYKEAAEIIGITPSGIKKHIVTGLAALRDHFRIKKKDKNTKFSTLLTFLGVLFI
ncbi:MAG: RNA polymerase sigma-70 factor [Prevotella sp.]|nr:RNA polymerase sigma-70 factor [Prevotella sp.]